MSLFSVFCRVLINGRANTRTFCLGKLLRTEEGVDRNSEKYVYDYDPDDRSELIDVNTSIRYMESKAFKETYGDNLVWTLYRRNYPKHFQPETRKTCIRQNKIATGSPCPICRDKYLFFDHRNIKLLKQFISPHFGGVLPTKKTGICQKQQKNLQIALLRAKDYGTISFDVPFRHYDYNYYRALSRKNLDKNKAAN